MQRFCCRQFRNTKPGLCHLFCDCIMTCLVLMSCDHYKRPNMRQITPNNFLNSTCNLSLLLNTNTSFLCWKLASLLIRSHPLLVSMLLPSLDFTENTIPTFKNHLGAVLPSFPLLISVMAYILSALERLRMLSRSPELFKIS